MVEPGDDLPLGGGGVWGEVEEAGASQGHQLEGQEYRAKHWNIIIFGSTTQNKLLTGCYLLSKELLVVQYFLYHLILFLFSLYMTCLLCIVATVRFGQNRAW